MIKKIICLTLIFILTFTCVLFLDHSPSKINTNILYNVSWHHKSLETPKAWEYSTGKGITVAVCDSGSDKHHNLKNVIRYNSLHLSHDYSLTKEISESYHGTNVSGIIAANGLDGVYGIAPDVTLISIRQTDRKKELLPYSHILKCVIEAIKLDAKIVNISYAPMCDDPYFNDIAEFAHSKNVILVLSAGNEKKKLTYKNKHKNLICVTSHRINGSTAGYVNYGDIIDVAAPGNSIVTTSVNNSYEKFTGTSAAAPVVSGVLALIWSIDPSFTSDQVINLLYFSTKKHNDIVNKSEYYGWGRVNAYKAVYYANLYKIQNPPQFIKRWIENYVK